MVRERQAVWRHNLPSGGVGLQQGGRFRALVRAAQLRIQAIRADAFAAGDGMGFGDF